jgi:NAD-dependent SIR2 family protein deacetylase
MTDTADTNAKFAYCVKCHETTKQLGSKLVVTGKRARMAGKCEKCGGSTSVFVKSPTA